MHCHTEKHLCASIRRRWVDRLEVGEGKMETTQIAPLNKENEILITNADQIRGRGLGTWSGTGIALLIIELMSCPSQESFPELENLFDILMSVN